MQILTEKAMERKNNAVYLSPTPSEARKDRDWVLRCLLTREQVDMTGK